MYKPLLRRRPSAMVHRARVSKSLLHITLRNYAFEASMTAPAVRRS